MNTQLNKKSVSYCKIAFQLFGIFTILGFSSCKDKLTIEHSIEVEVVPIKPTTTTTAKTDAQNALMTREFLTEQFAIIKSEESIKSETQKPGEENWSQFKLNQ